MPLHRSFPAADGTTTRPEELLRRAATVSGRALRLVGSSRGRLRRTLRPRGYVPGMLSVVVPCYDVEEYLGDCLSSLRAQSYRDVEIIVVDDGSPDASAALARAHQRRDLRVRLIRRPNGGLSAARNTGVDAARGEFLTFVDSDDVVSPHAWTAAIEGLRESGSDFALTLYDRLVGDDHRHAQPWIRRAHARTRLGVSIEDFPEAMVNAVAWSKVYRRAFWDAAGLRFPEGKLYEDQPVSAAAFAAARAFDVRAEIGVSWRIRLDRSSITQKSSTTGNLVAHNEAVTESLAALRARGRDRAVEARAVQVLANNLPFFTRHILKTDDEYWGLLREILMLLTEIAPEDEYVRAVSAQDKVLDALVVADRRQDAETFLEEYGHESRRFPTTVTPEGVTVALPFSDSVPASCSRLSEPQTELFARVLRVQWEESRLTVSGWAFLRNVDLADAAVRIELALLGDDGSEVPMSVRTFPEARADAQGNHWYADYRPGGFAAELDTTDLLPGDLSGDARWRFRLRFTAHDLVREGVLEDVSVAGSASVAQTRVAADGTTWRVGRGETGELELVAGPHPAHALSATVDVDRGGRLRVELAAPDLASVLLAPTDAPDRPVTSAVPQQGGGGTWTVELDASAAAGTSQQLWVRSSAHGDPAPLVAPADLPVAPVPATAPGPVPARGRTGFLEVGTPGPVATAVRLGEDTVVVRCAGGDADLSAHVPVMRAGDHEVRGTCTPADDPGTFDLELPLIRTVWGRDGLALPPGKYSLTLQPPMGSAVPVAVADDLLASLPFDLPDDRNPVRVEVFARRTPRLALNLRGPLTDEERGFRNQRRLREECRVERADADSVFFRALYGEVANCNMLGVHEELRRRGSPLRLLWSVRDLSVPVPPGGIALVEGSREWHEAIARSRYQMVNVHQLDWFVKPEGQVLIETMHGYPYKVMGHQWWAKGGFSGSQIRSYDRRAREWDYLVSPATYATPLLRKAFLDPAGSPAEVLEIGYPRNDALQGPRAATAREATRRLLGVRPDQTVVIYAPTFRDYLSADDMTAQRADFLDVDRAVRRLGDDYVFLMRGHAFHARSKGRATTAPNIIDVTDHPDINDLILASDAAVLDYSSIRFDYAITGKPMIFLVPDLDRYDATRGGVIPYRPTAPGPHVTTTREVIALLRDLPALSRQYADALETFRTDYVDLDDGHASARLVDTVFVPRGDAPAAPPG